MKVTDKILLAVILALSVTGLHARVNVSFETVTLDVDAHTVYSMLQDSEGLIWVGTNEGLYSYDGYSLHRHYEKGTPGNSHIYSIVESDGCLLLGADSGVLAFDLEKDAYGELPAMGFPREVRALEKDGSGNLWIGSLNGLYCYNLENESLERVENGIPHKAVYDIAVMSSGDVYVATYDGLAVKSAQESDFHEITELSEYRNGKNLFVNSLLEDSSGGCLWIGTSGDLFRYDFSGREFEVMEQLHENTIKSMACNGEGTLYMGTDGGLLIMEDGKVSRLRHDSRDPGSLVGNVVWTVMVDREDNVWAGTDSDISVLPENEWFETYPLTDLTSRGDGNGIFRILRDSRDGLWLGGTNGIIRMKDGLSPDGAEWYMMGDPDRHLSHNRVRDIYEDRHGTLWVATDGSINRYDYGTGRFINHILKDSTGVYNVNWSYNILEDESGNIWTGGYLGGILVIERDRLIRGGEVADRAYNTSNGLPTDYLNMMVTDRDGDKWAIFYQSDRLIRIDSSDGGVHQYDFFAQVGMTPYLILADDRGEVWCGFQGGVAKVAPDGNVTGVYRLPDPEVNLMAMAQVNDEIWISTSYGVWSLDMDGGEMRLLPLPDAAWTCIYNDTAYGDVLLGGADRIMRVNPEIGGPDDERGGIIITDIHVNDMRWSTRGAGAVRRVESVELGHDENNISVSFSDLGYRMNNRPQFAWRLNGGDGDARWSYLAKGTAQISMANLESGEYVLEIMKAGAYGEDDIFRLPIRIRQAWYDTTFAKVAYAILTAALLAAVYMKTGRRRNAGKQEPGNADVTNYVPAADSNPPGTEAGPANIESPDEKMLSEITGIIEANLTDPNLNVEFVCGKSGMSSKQLYRLVKKYAGVSPVVYIRRIRMDRAGMLLRQRKFTVSEVMYMVGFSSSSYFAKCFIARFGCTPSQYMNGKE